MDIEYKKVVKIDELAHLIPFKAGASYGLLWRIFYVTRLLKYVHIKQYGKIAKSFNKICTHRKLIEMCERGYLKSPSKDVYCATNKVIPILKECGYAVNTLPSEPLGLGDKNELNNTEALIQMMKTSHFLTYLYPQFGKPKPYLIPDALLVQLDKENRKYKLTFLEIESKKPQWEQWLENKHNNYMKLASDIEFFLYWKKCCNLFSFPEPDVTQVKFNYLIVKQNICLI